MTSTLTNASVIEWAINESGYSVPSLAAKMSGVKASETLIREWILGESTPTRGQLTRLAELTHRPRSFFYRTAPPLDSGVPAKLRRAQGSAPRDLFPDELLMVRRARRRQKFVEQLVADDTFLDLPPASTTTDAQQIAASLRSWSGIDIRAQELWKSDREAYRVWKSSLETRDVMVMEISMGRSGIRGFSLPSNRVPVVAVNTAMNDAARSFTLWHEIAHLCLDAAATCLLPHPEHAPQVERWCDEAASWVLMPQAELEIVLVRNRYLDEFDLVRAVAKHFRVSLRASAIAIEDVDEQFSGLFERVDHEFPIDTSRPDSAKGGGGRPRAKLRLAEIGTVGARAISQALAEDRISELAARRVLKLDGQELLDLAAEATA